MKNKVKDMREGCLDRMNSRYFYKSTQIRWVGNFKLVHLFNIWLDYVSIKLLDFGCLNKGFNGWSYRCNQQLVDQPFHLTITGQPSGLIEVSKNSSLPSWEVLESVEL